mmetsp:Transcript_8884/g.11924  ORF Transcript_8884/g.11924 Transcript_8884/m.11924 type:complete len:132 (+) Transcript_8884:37-432(+)
MDSITVSGGFVEKTDDQYESTCDGVYVIQKDLYNKKHYFRRCEEGKIVPGSIYCDDRTDKCLYWKIWRSGKGKNDGGWNFSQVPDDPDSPFPPFGVWVKEKASKDDSLGGNNYENLEVQFSGTDLKPAKRS